MRKGARKREGGDRLHPAQAHQKSGRIGPGIRHLPHQLFSGGRTPLRFAGGGGLTAPSPGGKPRCNQKDRAVPAAGLFDCFETENQKPHPVLRQTQK